MLQAVGTNKGYVTKIPGLFFEKISGQFDTPLRHTQGRIDQQFHRSRFPPKTTKIQVDLIVRYNTVELFLEVGGIREVNVAARSHISADHDTINSFRWICNRHINHKNLFPILTENVPDCLSS